MSNDSYEKAKITGTDAGIWTDPKWQMFKDQAEKKPREANYLKTLIKNAIDAGKTLSEIALLEYELEYHKYCKKQKNKDNLLTIKQYISFRVVNEGFTKYK